MEGDLEWTSNGREEELPALGEAVTVGVDEEGLLPRMEVWRGRNISDGEGGYIVTPW